MTPLERSRLLQAHVATLAHRRSRYLFSQLKHQLNLSRDAPQSRLALVQAVTSLGDAVNRAHSHTGALLHAEGLALARRITQTPPSIPFEIRGLTLQEHLQLILSEFTATAKGALNLSLTQPQADFHFAYARLKRRTIPYFYLSLMTIVNAARMADITTPTWRYTTISGKQPDGEIRQGAFIFPHPGSRAFPWPT